MIEIAGLLLVSGLKFLFAPSSVLLAGYNYWQTILITVSGGSIGSVFFFYLGAWSTEKISALYSRSINRRKKDKKLFTRKNRFLVKVKRDYGIIGLAIITPVIISIPVGCIIAARYYRKDNRMLPFLLISIVIWSLLLTSVSAMIFPYTP